MLFMLFKKQPNKITEDSMKKRNVSLLGILVMVLVFGMVVVGCASGPKAPASFVKGSAGDTTILLRQGLEFDQAFREVAFLLNRHGFETEVIQPEVGYIRTRWNRWDSKTTVDAYRVRMVINFNPSRTQVIVKAEAEYFLNNEWVQGYDSRAIETLRSDLNNVIGN
jgi:hypothetical protein